MKTEIYKIHFKEKEYLLFGLNESTPVETSYIERWNDVLKQVFGKDAGDILFIPTEINVYGFENINNLNAQESEKLRELVKDE